MCLCHVGQREDAIYDPEGPSSFILTCQAPGPRDQRPPAEGMGRLAADLTPWHGHSGPGSPLLGNALLHQLRPDLVAKSNFLPLLLDFNSPLWINSENRVF